VPGTEGRAGMAALALAAEVDLSGEEFFRHVERLPAYARPVFLRVVDNVDMTGTFKVRKVGLQQQGFDPRASTSPLYFRDAALGRYRVLDEATYERARNGGIRF